MSASLRQACILIIDDFQGMRTLLRDFVKNMGVTQIDTASNGKDAISQIERTKYDIVICDYNLGAGQNGQQVLDEVKLRNLIGVSTVWVMVTAEKTSDMVTGAAEVKPDDYLLKPINQSLLENRLEKLIARKQSLLGIEKAIKSRDYPSAIAQCDQQLKTDVINPQEILRIKSDLLLTTGDYDAARALFETALAERSVPWASTGLGRLRFYARDYAGAKEIFQEVVRENKVYMEAFDWLAKTLNALGEGEEAQKVLTDAVKLSPNSPVRQKTLGDTAYSNGALDVAQSAFEKTIKIGEFSPHKNSAVFAGLARVFSDKDSPTEALKILERSKKEFKHNTQASIQTAAAESVVYNKMGQTDKAEAALATAEQLMEKMAGNVNPETAMEVAKSLFKLGKKEKACGLLRELAKNNHENAEISLGVESVFQSENMAEEGQALINKSRQEVVDINNQGVLLAKKGDFLAGVKLLREAAKTLANNEVILVNLCGLLIGLINKEGKNAALAAEAKGLLERVRELNPANKKCQAYSLALTRIMNG